MVYVPEARKFGFDLRLNEDVMRDVLNSPRVVAMLGQETATVADAVKDHVRAVASPESAENYVGAMFSGTSTSDAYGFEFDGPYELGNRPIGVVGITRNGPDANGKPPFMVEADTHALTSAPGFAVGSDGEDVR